MEKQSNTFIASICAIFTATTRFFPEIVEKYGRWFYAAALARSDLNPLHDSDAKKGLFALSERLFTDVCRQIGLDGKSIFDPLANSLVTAKYFRWTYDKYAELVPDETERLLCAFLSLDVGYFTTKAVIKSVASPPTFDRVFIVLNREEKTCWISKLLEILHSKDCECQKKN